MKRPLLIPKLGLTTTETTVVSWQVAPGQPFRAGQTLLVVESEKAAIEVPAEADGVWLSSDAEPGTVMPVGAVAGYWEGGQGQQGPAPVSARPESAEPKSAKLESAKPGPRLLATPLARRLAGDRGIDLSSITGSGPNGRIRARDLDDLPPAVSPSGAERASQRPAGPLRPPTGIEMTIARRLVEAKRDIPHFYLALEAEVSALLALRADINAAQSRQKLSINHCIVAAVGRALADCPQANRVWTEDGILTLADTDVGLAVDTPKGLMVPVLRRVGEQPLLELARTADEAASRARDGGLPADAMAGGAITVSNAGMHGVTYMSSIIVPGQAMILGVGSVRELFRPDAAGQPRLVREIGLVLSADHRVLDGVRALGFLKRVVNRLEHPAGLLL